MTEKQILDYLNQCEFPMLDNGYYYHADQEMIIYRNNQKWVIVLQVIQYNNHCLDLSGFSTIVYKYGSDIDPEHSFSKDSFYHVAKNGNEQTFIEEKDVFNSYLNPLANHFKINQISIPIEHDRLKYAKNGIELESEDKIRPWEVLRYVTPKFSNHFWISRDELQIDSNLKEEIKFAKWEHPDNIDTIISDMNSFKEISKCLAVNSEFNKSEIETEHSNTHWSNWPEGGVL